MPEGIVVLRLNSVIKIGIPGLDKEPITGLVVGICISINGIEYQVVWWEGRNRKCDWINSVEVTETSDSLQRIGFK